MKLKAVWISCRLFWPKPAWDFHVNIIYPKWNELAQTRWMLRLMRMCVWKSLRVWISYRSIWQKWNFISGDKISCKHYPKWNAYSCLSKYRVVLKFSWNESSCEHNLFHTGLKSQTGMSSLHVSCTTLQSPCSYYVIPVQVLSKETVIINVPASNAREETKSGIVTFIKLAFGYKMTSIFPLWMKNVSKL